MIRVYNRNYPDKYSLVEVSDDEHESESDEEELANNSAARLWNLEVRCKLKVIVGTIKHVNRQPLRCI
jgi:hypothetical protein